MPAGDRDNPIPRPGARVILLDGEDRVLLMHGVSEKTSAPDLWFGPGGSLEPGEASFEAARRELWEETGITEVDWGPLVWQRRLVWRWGETWYDGAEDYYLARVLGPTPPVVSHVKTEMELESDAGHRWWTLEEIAAASDQVFVPRALAELLGPLLEGRLPPSPLQLGE